MTRPVWEWDFPQDAARWLLPATHVHTIEACTAMAGDFQTSSWLVFYTANSKRKFDAFPEQVVRFFPGFGDLIGPTPLGEQMLKRVKEIDAWEVENANERAEYERLKRKFES